jgi:hypothetical protein
MLAEMSTTLSTDSRNQGISSSVEDASTELTDMLRRTQLYFEFAPEALLVLLLLDCGKSNLAFD